MTEPVSILLVGIGGFGNNYVRELLNYKGEDKFKIVGAVDPNPENCSNLDGLKERKVPVFSSMEDFYTRSGADLAVISSPIQFHSSQSCYALSQGSNVLCEKPLSATVQDALKMIDARDKSGKFLAIGYQWSYSDAILALKKDILNGLFGKPERLKTIVLWPRNDKYFTRGWAGRKKDPSGKWVLDSVANNAASHYLHNMFFILGESIDTSAYPVRVTAELYRARDIENFDTGAARAITEEGVEVMFLATHAVNERIGPKFIFEYENANIMMENSDQEGKGAICARFHDGSVKVYGNPFDDRMKKIWVCIDAVRGTGTIPCGPDAALAQTLCINAMQDSMPDIIDFPQNLVKHDENLWDNAPGIYVDGLNDIMKKCYDNWRMPGESNVLWAQKGEEISLDGYISYGE